MPPSSRKFVSRAGNKLDAALESFGLDVTGLTCADFGCNIGGFTDCLFRRGAKKVFAVDTGYGALAWKLRKDPRVVVMERTNALHCPPPEPVDLVVIDVVWTPQQLIVPAAAKWLKPQGERGEKTFPPGMICLLKPHYELTKMQKLKPRVVLTASQTIEACLEVSRRLDELGWPVRAIVKSPIKGKGGNTEFLLWL